MSDLINKFKESCENVKKISNIDDDILKNIYGYYKQATCGDINTERPDGFLEFKEKSKWDAWESKKGLSKESAMRKYIRLIDELINKSKFF